MSNPKKPGTGATNKRRRELAAAKLERQSARRAERAARRRRTQRIGWTMAALAGVALIAVVLLWPDTAGDDLAEPAATPTPTGGATADIGCEPAPTPPAEPLQYGSAPEMALAAGSDYTLTLDTNCGEVVIDTTPRRAPQTVNAMLWLAQEGYFDNTLCHRLTTDGIFVLQCGDPTASGSGGPGFQLPDENLPIPPAADTEADGSASPTDSASPTAAPVVTYPAGTVAMANAGPGTSGSQFFLVYQDSPLPAAYTIWGRVTEGLDVVETVAEAGVLDGGTDGTPAASIGILGTTVDPELG